MADVKWIKLATSLPDDPKVKRILRMPSGNTILNIWIFILIIAGKSNNSGGLFITDTIPFTAEDIADNYNIKIDTVNLAIKVFIELKMIDIYDNVIYVSNWEKHQSIEGLEKIRKQTNKRVQKYRKKQKQLCNVTSALHVTHSNATELDKEKELDKDIIYISECVANFIEKVIRFKNEKVEIDHAKWVETSMELLDKYSYIDIERVIDYAFYYKNNNIWRGMIVEPDKLLEHFKTIYNQMCTSGFRLKEDSVIKDMIYKKI